jgi:hypothetical protein
MVIHVWWLAGDTLSIIIIIIIIINCKSVDTRWQWSFYILQYMCMDYEGWLL